MNEAFADKYWPHQDAIGKRLRLKDQNGTQIEVVGVTKTGRYIFIAEPPMPFVYLPFTQAPRTQMTIFVETTGNPADIAAPLREIVRSLDANLPIYNARTLDNFYQQRAISIVLMLLQLISAMGLLGLSLALVGLYGLIAYSVSRRTQEIGIRMAMGARRLDVVGMVLRQGLMLSLIGVAIGLVASIGLRNVLRRRLGRPGRPAVRRSWSFVPAALILVTVAACYLPARRASLIDPIRALRYE